MLPNGDVLVAESNGPPRPDDARGIKGWVTSRIMERAGATVPSANRIALLRDTDGDGVPDGLDQCPNTPRDALSRLETMIAMASLNLPERAMRQQISSAIQVVIQMARLTDEDRHALAEWRVRLDALPLDPETAESLAAEACEGFRRHIALFRALVDQDPLETPRRLVPPIPSP